MIVPWCSNFPHRSWGETHNKAKFDKIRPKTVSVPQTAQKAGWWSSLMIHRGWVCSLVSTITWPQLQPGAILLCFKLLDFLGATVTHFHIHVIDAFIFYLVGGLEHFIFSIIYIHIYMGSSFPLTFIFFKMVKTTNQLLSRWKWIRKQQVFWFGPGHLAQVERRFAHWCSAAVPPKKSARHSRLCSFTVWKWGLRKQI